CACSGQADIGGVDAEPVHVVKELDFLVDGGRADRRRLEPVSQRLVIEHGDGARRRSVVIPVVDERLRGKAHRETPVTRMAPAAAVASPAPRMAAGRIQSSMFANGPNPAASAAWM